jgi:outer membrane beta-barrel protein
MLLAVALVLTAPLAAQEEIADVQEPERIVIQNRKFKLGHELTFAGGTLPLDPFYKGIAGTVRYTWHLNDFNAWEVAGGTYAFNLDSALTEQLLNNFAVSREELPGLLFLVDTNYVMKPFYGKFALANRTLLYQELFLLAGVTGSFWSNSTVRVGPDVGGGIRFFLADWASLRFDIRHAIVFSGIPFVQEDFTLDGVLYLGAGLSFNIGG